ncbi:flagellar hook-length control protein FliK [Pseudoxanthomonas mexicana]|uniref:Flagellar hook-length control protein FliK n=1 Tax=Pseudoxanthomonas mexicana TaxID=128785 RepID=A0ABX6RD63_PSEMX|nr:flagellar hook-length control protein FliK [Pseudoxanthomonas mexicana]QLQ29010.1 MAG: flagellar hook-length control protein FliK [Pseudoxanthomonas sp.]QND81205.1 flagellar hook-length control protein FliK [Pseudoxanthomonas mexicana]
MPSPTSALSFATPASAPATTPANATMSNDDGSATKKPAFDDMVRRPARRDDAARTQTSRAGEAKDRAAPRPERTADRPEEAAPASTEKDTTEEALAASSVPPILMELPPIQAPTPLAAAAVVVAEPIGNPLLAGAQLMPSAPVHADGLPTGGATAMPAALMSASLPDMAVGIPPDTSPDSTTPVPAGTATTSQPASAATDAKAPLQNLLSFAAHLATGQLAAAVPDAIHLGRDLVDAFRSEEGDAPTPTGNLLAGVGASNAPLGLARTETVNAMEAPSTDLHGGHFDEDIGDAVRWMADQKIGHAHIKVTPNDLGTVEIRLRLDGDRVHADFSSAQAEVRQALENGLPRLRDMLGQHGFQLAHADVGQQHTPPSQGAAPPHGESPADTEALTETPRTVRMTARGLVDAYA